MIVAFWILAALIAYALVGYGLLWIAAAALFGKPAAAGREHPLRATMLIAARNEAATIRAKLDAVLAQDTGSHTIDVLVVSDGSEDATNSEVRALASPRVRLLELRKHAGKDAALEAGLVGIDADVVIFSDANSVPALGALRALLAPFAEPAVGGACGRPRPRGRRGGWIGRAEASFWIYDSALKRAESWLGGAVSAQGTLYALRRKLLPITVPAGVADDLFFSLQAVDRGGRLVFVPEAVAVEEVTARTGDEFKRRVRSTERGWRGLMMMSHLLDPRRYGLYAIQLFSHKVLRRLVAFLLPVWLAVSLSLVGRGAVYDLAAVGQVVVYGLGLAALAFPAAARLPGAGAAGFFVMGHAAMALGILRVGAGRRTVRWAPVRDEVR